MGAGEKLAEAFLGPHIGGGIEYWFAYVLALVVLLVAAARPVRRTHHRADLRRQERALSRSRPVQDLLLGGHGDLSDPPGSDRARTAAAFVFVGVPLLAHFHVWPFGGDYLLRAILIPFLILALATIGMNILVGYCGQISLGGGAFMAIGAYSAYKFGTGVHIPLAWFGIEISIPPLPVFSSILLGGLMSAIVGILFGIPSLRIKGLYLAVATLAAQFFFDWVFIRVKWFTNYAPSGSVAAPELNFFGLTVNSSIERYLLCLDVRDCVRADRQEPRARQSRPAVDGDPRHGHRRRADGHPAVLCQAHGLCRVVVHGRCRRRAVGFCLSRRLGAAGLRYRPVVPVAVHGHHRRTGVDPGIVPGRGFHSRAADPARPGAARAWHPHLRRDRSRISCSSSQAR